jgi:hypothetical protein
VVHLREPASTEPTLLLRDPGAERVTALGGSQ